MLERASYELRQELMYHPEQAILPLNGILTLLKPEEMVEA